MARLMRYLTCTVMGLVLWAACPTPLLAGSAANKMCKKIHDAIRAGHTVDQMIAELNTDAETIVKCTQKRGKRKAAPKSKKAAKSSSKYSSSSAPSAEQSKSAASSTRKPSAPRSGPLPAHLP
jgi:hypothetical protein